MPSLTRRSLSAVALSGLLTVASDRAHWRRSDWRPADPKAVAAALTDCERGAVAADSREKAVAACMSKHGYFTWDGV